MLLILAVATYLLAMFPNITISPLSVILGPPIAIVLMWCSLPFSFFHNIIGIEPSNAPAAVFLYICIYWLLAFTLIVSFIKTRRWFILPLLAVLFLMSAKGCIENNIQDHDDIQAEFSSEYAGRVAISGPSIQLEAQGFRSDNTLKILCSSPNEKMLRIIHGNDTNGPWKFPAGNIRFDVALSGEMVSLIHVDKTNTILSAFNTAVAGIVLKNEIGAIEEFGHSYKINILGSHDGSLTNLFVMELDFYKQNEYKVEQSVAGYPPQGVGSPEP